MVRRVHHLQESVGMDTGWRIRENRTTNIMADEAENRRAGCEGGYTVDKKTYKNEYIGLNF